MLAKVWSAALVGIDAIKVGVEVDIAGGLPGIVVVGLPDTAVQESRERVKAALKNAGYAFPMRKIVINLTPADLRKEGPSFDLPISVGVLAGSEQVNPQLLEDYLFLGEVSLDGGLRPVAGVVAIAATAYQLGIKGLVVPMDNAREAAVVEGLEVYGFQHLSEVDIGTIEDNKFLKITDRKKELFKTSGGKYVAPLPIENKLKESRFIEQVIVVGSGQKFVGALIIPSFSNLGDWAKDNGIKTTTREALIKEPKVLTFYQELVETFNKHFNHVEQIKKFELLPNEWSVETGEMTPKMSIKRKVVMEKFQAEVEKIYL